MSRFVRGVDALALGGAALSCVLLGAIALMMGASIFSRYALNADVPFAWEYSGYLMSAVFFLGAAYALRTGTHIRLGLLSLLPWPRVRLAGELVATLVALAVALLIAWALGDQAWQAWGRDARSFTPMQTPLAIPQALPALGAALLCLQLVARLVAACKRLPLEDNAAGAAMSADR